MSEFLLRTARRLRDAGNLAEAARLYGEILRLDPRQGEALSALGAICYAAMRFEEAARLLGEAASIDPQSADTWFTHACALQRLNRQEEALSSYERAIALEPGRVDALVNRGAVLMKLNRHEEALSAFDAALSADPSSARALVNRGNALQELLRYGEALPCYDKALALEPGMAEALVNRGSALSVLKRYDEAVEDYEKAFALKPDVPFLRGNLVHYRLLACDWRHYDEDASALAKGVREGKRVVLPFVNVTISRSPAEQLQCARIAIAEQAPQSPLRLWRGEQYRHDRIRLAYISADFREHAVARLIAGVLEEHDRTRFETVALSLMAAGEDKMRKRIARSFDSFLDIGRLSDAEAARVLRQREIDIAVDLTGFTTGGRPGILACRPAPIQANFLGYPGTMGAAYIDYIVADAIVIPGEHRPYYAEKVVALPGTYQANDAKREIAGDPPARAEAGLPERGFVFASFNNNNKIAPEMFGVWMRILAQAGDSVLWLLEDNAAAARNLRREAEARGIAGDRLVFAPRVDSARHLARHRLADLFLDTLPYGAHTTASDALWAGLPLLTLLGGTFAGRVAASLLNAIGVPETIARSAEEYEALALKLARDPHLLSSLKKKLAANRETHALFDTRRFTRNLEAAYTGMLERHRQGLPPEHFAAGDALQSAPS